MEKNLKIKNLRKMQAIASFLLVFALSMFILAIFLEIDWLKAIAEASLVGAIADWFAVVAIFRHPMGIKIPHTALIIKQKDNIGKNMGKFIKNEFISKDNIDKYFENIDFAEHIGKYIQKEDNAKNIREIIISGITANLDPMIKMFISQIDINRFLQQKIIDFSIDLQEKDTPKKDEINKLIREKLSNYIVENNHLIEQFISSTISSWDSKEISDKIELELAKDLQFIRINGTIIGGLVGLCIYFVSNFI